MISRTKYAESVRVGSPVDVNQNVLRRCRFDKQAALAKILLQIHEPDY